ncbi:MAG: DNA recombination protein RmuC [Solirubrobacteraceae bacterium]
MEFVFALLVGLILGGAAVWTVVRARMDAARTEALHSRELLDQYKQEIPNAVKAASSDASQSLMDLMVKPISESLQRVDGKLESLEKARHQAHGQLSEHLKTVTTGQDQLRRETASLVTALRAPATRGRWGELQLKRVCEMAGMIEHCDFEQQSSADTDEGRVRPDLIVKLPGGMNVVVDAKVPLEAYLNALEAEDEDVRASHLEAYGRHVRDHLRKLGAKAYQDSFSPTPEFVVLFLPSEAFHSAALEQVPDLIQDGVENKVLIATPTSLIGLLKVVAYGWRQEQMAASAEEIADLGRKLHKRIATMAGHLAKLGRAINTTANTYNDTVGSLERQVLVSARKLSDHGVESGKEIESPAQVETAVRSLQAPELVEGDDPDDIRVTQLPKLAS